MDTRGLCAFDAGVNGSGVSGRFFIRFSRIARLNVLNIKRVWFGLQCLYQLTPTVLDIGHKMWYLCVKKVGRNPFSLIIYFLFLFDEGR